MSVEVAYVGNHGSHVFFGDNPAANVNTARSHRRLCGQSMLDQPAASVLRWRTSPMSRAWEATSVDAEHRLLLQLRRRTWYSRCRRKPRSASAGATRCSRSTPCSMRTNNDGDYFFIDPDVNRGTADFDRTHNVHSCRPCAEIPVGRGKRMLSDAPVSSTRSSAAGSSTRTRSSRAASRSTFSYRNAGQDRDTGPNRPDLIGDPDGPQTRDQWFNAAPIGEPGQRIRPAGQGDLRQSGPERPARAGLLADRRVAVQELHAVGRPPARGPHRGSKHLQPREPGQPRLGGWRAWHAESQRRAHHGNRVRQWRSAANFQFGFRFVF